MRARPVRRAAKRAVARAVRTGNYFRVLGDQVNYYEFLANPCIRCVSSEHLLENFVLFAEHSDSLVYLCVFAVYFT